MTRLSLRLIHTLYYVFGPECENPKVIFKVYVSFRKRRSHVLPVTAKAHKKRGVMDPSTPSNFFRCVRNCEKGHSLPQVQERELKPTQDIDGTSYVEPYHCDLVRDTVPTFLDLRRCRI